MPETSTKQQSRFRLCCFTIFDMAFNFDQLKEKVQYLCYGREVCPKTQREHYQCFAYASTNQRWTWWQKLLSPHHFEQCHGTLQDNARYCSKSGDYTEWGTKPMGDGKRRDLANVCDAIKEGKRLCDIASDYPATYVQYHRGLDSLSYMLSKPYAHDDVRGVWIWGPPGAGKSYYARDTYQDLYIKSQNKWFDGYVGQPHILLDDYDAGDMLGHYMKIWMDRYSCQGETKGGHVHLQHKKFIVTSNYSIDEMFGKDPVKGPALVDAIKRRCEIIYMINFQPVKSI